MTKFYISSGSFNMVVSKRDAMQAALYSSGFITGNHIIDEFFYIDERGFRDYISADPKTIVLETMRILEEENDENLLP